MRIEDFQAITSYSFRDNPVDSGLSLFVTGTDTVTNSVVMELLEKELKERDGKVCLAISSYFTLKHSFPHIAEDERVKLVIVDSYEYIKVLSEAGRIFTVWLLPNYYVKKDGQVVYEAISRSRLKEKSSAAARAANARRTDNNTDYYIRDELYEALCVKSASESSGLSILLPSNHYNPGREVELLRDVKSFVKKGKVVYGVSSAAWDYLTRLNDSEPELVKDVYPFTLSFKEIFAESSTIICANDSLSQIAVRSGKNSIFYGRTDMKLSAEVMRASDIYEAIEKGVKLLEERSEVKDRTNKSATYDLTNLCLEDFYPCNPKSTQKKVLIAANWKERAGIVYIADFIRNNSTNESVDFDFLLVDADKQEISKESETILADVNVLTRDGIYQFAGLEPSSGKDDDKKESFDFNPADIEREWKRLVGAAEYDEVWISANAGDPLVHMDKYIPGEKSRVTPLNEMMKQFLNFIGENGVVINQLKPEDQSGLSIINGEEFCSLGTDDGKDYFISKKVFEQGYILVKYSRKSSNKIKKMIAQSGNDSEAIIIINPEGKELPELMKNRKVIEFPSRFAAPKLISSAYLLIAEAGEAETILAEMMSVPVKIVS